MDGQQAVGKGGVHGDHQLVLGAGDSEGVDGLEIEIIVEPVGKEANSADQHHQDEKHQRGLTAGLVRYGDGSHILHDRLADRPGSHGGVAGSLGFQNVVDFAEFTVQVEDRLGSLGGDHGEDHILLGIRRRDLRGLGQGDVRPGGLRHIRHSGDAGGKAHGGLAQHRGLRPGRLRGRDIHPDGGVLGHGRVRLRPFRHLLDRCFRYRSGLRLSRSGGLLARLADGGIPNGAQLHVGHNGLTKLCRVLPPVLRLGGAGLEDDLGHGLVGVGRSGEGPGRVIGKLRQHTAVEEPVEDHAQGIGIQGGVQGGHGVFDLGGCVGADIALRHGTVVQVLGGYKAKVRDFEVVSLYHNVGGLQVDVQVARPTAQRQGGAQVNGQIHRLKLGDGGTADGFFQSAAIGAHQKHLVAQPVGLHGHHLPALKAGEALQLGKALEELRLRRGVVCLLAEIVQGSGRIFVSACYQQSIQLNLGRGHG